MQEMTILCSECRAEMIIRDDNFLISKVAFVLEELHGLCSKCLEKHPEIKARFEK
jgi:hypothetical protein